MRRLTIVAISLVAFFSPILPVAAQAPLKVGVIAGFSGPGQVVGEACKNGFELGLARAPAGRVSVIYEDDQFTQSKTVSAFKKLTEVDRVDLVIVVSSGTSNAIAPLAEKKGIPLIAWASDGAVSRNRKSVFRAWVSGESEGHRIVEEITRRAYDRVGLLTITSDYARSVRSGIEARMKKGSFAVDEEYLPDAMDFKPFLLKLRQQSVTKAAVCLNPGQPAVLGKQAVELGMKVQFFGCETLGDMNEVSASSGGLLGGWFVSGAISDAFRSTYRQKFGNEDFLAGAAIHHDLAVVLAESLQGAQTPAERITRLKSAAVQGGALGDYGVVSEENDQYFNVTLVVKEITPEGFKPIG